MLFLSKLFLSILCCIISYCVITILVCCAIYFTLNIIISLHREFYNTNELDIEDFISDIVNKDSKIARVLLLLSFVFISIMILISSLCLGYRFFMIL